MLRLSSGIIMLPP